MRFITAQYIFPITSAPLENGVVQIDDSGQVIALHRAEAASQFADRTEHFEGLIVPGFVNTHCHLELSHLKGKIPEGTGLVPFISQVIGIREASEEIHQAMLDADREMRRNGIVAVGDISNKLISKEIKAYSEIRYHTFVELLGFNPGTADQVFNRAHELVNGFSRLRASMAPHAPYSVSPELLLMIATFNSSHLPISSIHMQESLDEDDLYRKKEGRFLDFYRKLGLDISFFKPSSKSSVQSRLPEFDDKVRSLLVHNTQTTAEDIEFIKQSGKDVFWCFCPNANQYIERQLPDIDLFEGLDDRITLGTDSLASNHQLCILSEMKMLRSKFPDLPFERMIRWATFNGARFLGMEDQLGSIEIGKRPGLNLITVGKNFQIGGRSTVRRIL